MTLLIFENFEIVIVLVGEFQIFQKCTRVVYPKSPSQTAYRNSCTLDASVGRWTLDARKKHLPRNQFPV